MSRTIIPGLTFSAADDDSNRGIDMLTFAGYITFPESVIYGSSRPQDEFEKLNDIYTGAFGRFYKCRHKINGQIYALKKFIVTDEMMKEGIPVSFLREMNILDLLKHENIVNSHGPVVGKILENNFLLLEYCITSLEKLIEKECVAIYESDVVKYMMKQLFEGINFIHESTVVHRNISCGSILFTESGTLKIGGFRNATFYSKENMTPVVTELIYMAPELLFEAKSYGFPVDIWAIGCIFAKLLLRKPLFCGDSVFAVLKTMFSALGTPSEEIWPGFTELLNTGTFKDKKIIKNNVYTDMKNICSEVPDSSFQLLQDLLIYYPAARLTALEVLKNPYFFHGSNGDCTSEKMAAILQTALT